VIVVSDTSPLNYLALIGHEWLLVLERLFGSVVIPPAVANELLAEGSPPVARALIQASPPWLSVRKPDERLLESVKASTARLGAGELEAITLAMELKADLLLADERRATKEAREKHHLRVTGVLGVLQAAATQGLIDLPTVVDALAKTNYRMPKKIVARLVEQAARRTSRPAE
jgi:predicted nucleic acid-binding protein